MDNLTHALTGAGLAALAYGTPEISGNPHLGQAVFWGIMTASQVPDFDFVIRFKGKRPYLKHHRGFSHSLPAQIMIPSLVTLGVVAFFPGANWWVVWLWSWLATLLHIFLDLLTAYGTKFLWPISNKAYAWDILMIVDPVIILLTGTGVALWYWDQAPPANIFLFIFAVLVLYLGTRAYLYLKLKKVVTGYFDEELRSFSVIPTMHLRNWSFLVETPKAFLAGVVNWPVHLEVEKKFPKKDEDEIIAAAWKAPGARVFIEFARHMWVDYEKTGEGYRVYFQDLRFLFGDRTPFTATVILDQNLQLVDEDFGWRQRA